MKKKLSIVFVVLLAVSLILAACSKDESNPGASGSGDGQTQSALTSGTSDTGSNDAGTVTDSDDTLEYVEPLPNGDPEYVEPLPNGDPDTDAQNDGTDIQTSDSTPASSGTETAGNQGMEDEPLDTTGLLRSHLTGEYKSAEAVNSRPLSIIFNNLEIASPQAGIGEASIVYEALAEGGITRLMGIFEDLSSASSCSERIGSVRSARHYFVSVADEYDSIFISYGGTPYADKLIESISLDHLNGTTGYGVKAFYRDDSIASPHNAFTSVELLKSRIAAAGFRTVHEDDYTNTHFTFEDEVVSNPRTVRSAGEVDLNYSSYISPMFKFDSATGLYTRYQFGNVHTDALTGKPLTFTNIIIQLVHEYNKDDQGYQEIELDDTSGVGYYVSMGKYEPITWKKNENLKTCTYYDSKGNVLCINPGKTFISIFPDYRASKLTIQ